MTEEKIATSGTAVASVRPVTEKLAKRCKRKADIIAFGCKILAESGAESVLDGILCIIRPIFEQAAKELISEEASDND